jgi:hypothetical protein
MNVEESLPKKITGFYAWILMALGIFTYDMYAIRTQKFETMSTALWNSLAHPFKSAPLIVIWLTVTHHLFGNSKARNSYKQSASIILAKRK